MDWVIIPDALRKTIVDGTRVRANAVKQFQVSILTKTSRTKKVIDLISFEDPDASGQKAATDLQDITPVNVLESTAETG